MDPHALCMAELWETLGTCYYSSLLSYSTKLPSLVHIRLQGPWLLRKVISTICVLLPTSFSLSPPSFSPLPVSFVHFSFFKTMKQPLRNCSQKTGLLTLAVSLILAIFFGASCLVRYWQGWLQGARNWWARFVCSTRHWRSSREAEVCKAGAAPASIPSALREIVLTSPGVGVRKPHKEAKLQLSLCKWWVWAVSHRSIYRKYPISRFYAWAHQRPLLDGDTSVASSFKKCIHAYSLSPFEILLVFIQVSH